MSHGNDLPDLDFAPAGCSFAELSRLLPTRQYVLAWALLGSRNTVVEKEPATGKPRWITFAIHEVIPQCITRCGPTAILELLSVRRSPHPEI